VAGAGRLLGVAAAADHRRPLALRVDEHRAAISSSKGRGRMKFQALTTQSG
jgi:hypothetical protein